MSPKKFLVILLEIYFINCQPIGHETNGGLSNTVLTPLSDLDQTVNEKIKQAVNSKAINFVPPFPDSGRKYAVTEFESPVSQLDTKYSQLQDFAAVIFNPKPIVDTITENEKYGNDGDKFRTVGTAVIGGVEAFSNLLNAAISVPFEGAKQVGRKITTTLNMVGGKLVGLA